MCGTAPSSSTPPPMPTRPASTSVVSDTCLLKRRTICVPNSIPRPTLPLTKPNKPALACSVSRTQIEMSGAKQPIVKRPDAIASTKNRIAAWCRMKLIPCFMSIQIA